MLGYWILIQVAASVASPAAGGGVAYTAHIGGFVAGFALIVLFRNRRLVRAKKSGVVLSRHDLDEVGWW
jgi:membrane associated rhomboid family serine protease